MPTTQRKNRSPEESRASSNSSDMNPSDPEGIAAAPQEDGAGDPKDSIDVLVEKIKEAGVAGASKAADDLRDTVRFLEGRCGSLEDKVGELSNANGILAGEAQNARAAAANAGSEIASLDSQVSSLIATMASREKSLNARIRSLALQVSNRAGK